MIEIKMSTISDGEFNRGVFAKQDIKKGTLIHEAPVIAYPNKEHCLLYTSPSPRDS